MLVYHVFLGMLWGLDSGKFGQAAEVSKATNQWSAAMFPLAEQLILLQTNLLIDIGAHEIVAYPDGAAERISVVLRNWRWFIIQNIYKVHLFNSRQAVKTLGWEAGSWLLVSLECLSLVGTDVRVIVAASSLCQCPVMVTCESLSHMKNWCSRTHSHASDGLVSVRVKTGMRNILTRFANRRHLTGHVGKTPKTLIGVLAPRCFNTPPNHAIGVVFALQKQTPLEYTDVF